VLKAVSYYGGEAAAARAYVLERPDQHNALEKFVESL
jgi:hypothetical protein